MTVRHAVLSALLDADASGYQLAKIFDVSVANFWHAVPQQLYAELARLEAAGLLTGREVVQERRPNKRVFAITDRGRAALREFIAGPSRPSFIRDDLLVKVHAAEAGDVDALVLELEERAAQAGARADLINSQLARLRGEQTEEQFLANSPRIGPYLTGMRGRQFETENAAWCTQAARILRARTEHAAPHA